MRIAFLGMGAMGAPMARNLIAPGHTLVAWNRTRAAADALAADGAGVAESVAQAVRGADAAITMLADDAAVEAVVRGGLLDALEDGAVHVCMSTISVALSSELARLHGERGQAYVAAPDFGRPDAAAERRLKIVASGAAEAVERCRPLFDALAAQTFYAGAEPSAAHVIKLCGNFLIASMIECLGETFALARKSGVEPAVLNEVLSGTVLGSPIFPGYARLIAGDDFDPPGFRMRLGLKDVRLVQAAAEAAQVPMPVAGILHDRFLGGVARGRGDHDWASAARLIAEDAGLG
ncbi:NAD(P)-dependent oxidoreductase [Longimicrobium terrae]|uniref:3-hydroxyisobutyrate dehydrogenase-like beta-hydroxyacid dehydrogenase n=2 Tax=Longimicrobium terrae TaxID=1639882 RepID=A0A841GZQ9_9BACT|nr:NAD(P)-dependent oxidoreductase [Longimicrobium terrae]MBB6071198.1 3-hydroxyisobutyrate dehydrogenase-like beta-hydroxyacid dehydrogenase [Longimicrobium terrae]NNC29245.1 NAD(P)-dependent oxidoreductase [Longimicrobium terrae]